MTSFGGKSMNVYEVIDEMHDIFTADGATAWHFDPDMVADVCGVSQCHHVHAELLCDQWTVASPCQRKGLNKTGRFSYTMYIQQ